MRRPLAALLALICLAGQVRAEELSAAQQSLLFLRVLAYDRNLKTRSEGALNVAVVYRGGNRDSEQARDAVVSALRDASKRITVARLPIRAVAVEFTSPQAFENLLQSEKISAVYVCPGLGDVTFALSAVTRKRAALTATSIESAVRGGLSIGLLTREGKPELLVNLPATRAEGANLDAALLRLAQVLR